MLQILLMYVAVFKYDKSSASLLSKLPFLFPYWLVLESFNVWFDIYIRRGNLPIGGYDKETWKRCRDLLTRHRENVTLRMGRRGYVPLRRLGDVLLRRRLVFHLRLVWGVVETYWWDVVVTSSWDVGPTLQ